MGATEPPRTSTQIIDAALAENIYWEWLCFALVILFVVVGIAVLAVGIIQQRDLLALAGSLVTGMFWPALLYANRFRTANIRIRLMELPLALAKTSTEATKVLRESLMPVTKQTGK